MVLTFKFFFHQGLDPVSRSEEISQHQSFIHYLIVFLIAFFFCKCSCKSCWSWASASLFPFGSTLCRSLDHFWAAFTGHFVGRAAAGKQDAAQSLTSSMATSALGEKPGEMHLKCPLEFRNLVRNAVLRDLFCRKGFSQSYSCPENFSLKP